MSLSLNKLYGRKLGASDGEIGSVKDFYFEDERWAVRYVVADTGSWLLGRQVLISPYAFSKLDDADDSLPVNLTRKQIEDSPAIETQKPISRQYEEAYHGYYQWPPYWNGGGLWGFGSYPAVTPPTPEIFPGGDDGLQPSPGNDPHLRSAQSIIGHEVQTSEGVIGSVTDFLVDEYGWMIRYLVVKTVDLYEGKEIVISPQHVDRVSYEEAMVYVRLTKEDIFAAPAYLALTLVVA